MWADCGAWFVLRSCAAAKKTAFVSFVTAGYPQKADTVPILLSLQVSLALRADALGSHIARPTPTKQCPTEPTKTLRTAG